MEEIAFSGGYSPRRSITEPQGRLSVSEGGSSGRTRCTFWGLNKTAKTGQNWFILVPTPDRYIGFADCVRHETEWNKTERETQTSRK